MSRRAILNLPTSRPKSSPLDEGSVGQSDDLVPERVVYGPGHGQSAAHLLQSHTENLQVLSHSTESQSSATDSPFSNRAHSPATASENVKTQALREERQTQECQWTGQH